jgi:uncharacterized protein with von Willebrand factor type A (vWA) domain
VKATIGVSDKAFAIRPTAASVDFEKAWRDAWTRIAGGTDPAQALQEADKTAQEALDRG